jgi:hypothetical protein
VALLAVVRPDGRPALPAGATSGSPVTTSRVPPTRPAVDLDTVRDVFHFEDGRSGGVGAPATPHATPTASVAAPPAAPEARLVGLVRRGPRLLAALALADEVVVLGAGDSAGGYAVLDVSEDGVRLRDPEGREETLTLP